MRFVVFQGMNAKWFWELRLPDASVVACSPLGLKSKAAAFEMVKSFRTAVAQALVFDLLGNLHEGV